MSDDNKFLSIDAPKSTGREIVLIVAVVAVIIAIAFAIFWSVNEAGKRDQELRLACINKGGIWQYNTCQWGAQ